MKKNETFQKKDAQVFFSLNLYFSLVVSFFPYSAKKVVFVVVNSNHNLSSPIHQEQSLF